MRPETDEAVVTACELDAPPETVWRALTEPHLVAEWLMPNDLRPEAGARFTLAPDRPGQPAVACEVLFADPPHRLAYTWREAEGPARDSVVTFELTPAGHNRTHLRIVHEVLAARRPATMTAGIRAGGTARRRIALRLGQSLHPIAAPRRLAA